MAAGAVRVTGLRESRAAFRRVEKELDREVSQGLKEGAEPVRQEARNLFAPIDARSAAGYRVRVRSRGIAIEQSRKRTTGKHPEFGALQMRRALVPARERRQAELIEGLERLLDQLASRNGF